MYPAPFAIRPPFQSIRYEPDRYIASRRNRFGIPDSFPSPDYSCGTLLYYFTSNIDWVFSEFTEQYVNDAEKLNYLTKNGLCLVIDSDISAVMESVNFLDFMSIPSQSRPEAFDLCSRINSHSHYLNLWSFSMYRYLAETMECPDPKDDNGEEMILVSELPGFDDFLPEDACKHWPTSTNRSFFMGMDVDVIFSSRTPSGIIQPFDGHELLTELLIDDDIAFHYQNEGFPPIYLIPIYDRDSSIKAIRFLRRVFKSALLVDHYLRRLVSLQEGT